MFCALGRLFRAMVVAALPALTGTVQALPMADDEAEDVRRVLVAQFDAFADDDADRAFETATPEVRDALGSSSRFLAMVRGAYPMVYRPRAIRFHKPEEDGDSVIQLVEITDDDAKSWIALFTLERQPDRSWRISGCVVSENRWQAI